ncbi:preprotein translocase subunit SecA [Sulfurifustis variabilis]|uniref:Protein translocase subunit SecA n=1 Tax=Sulfurifustis variabilis TaxID=1675686 RepID=A0A1B4V1J6_9GAMM|nr:preprotein translocase subunit SecA [Sulfurifustis variabilis]BAU47283.1 preprotein translocase subunit SecA [Sulfurifustis variabilis]
MIITKALTKVFGSRNARLLKAMQKQVERVNALEPGVASLSDEALRAKTAEFKTRLSQGETLDALLPEAFAVVREGSKRSLGMRHFDVQLVGGIVLHEGKIAEMKTGEGKTLVATLSVYLNALTGRGVHVVTVNEYLARRDAEWMGKLYNFLGMTVGVVVPGQDREAKRAAYAADITYGTNNEYGFDYLRDNMAFRAEDRVQRGLHYAIVDEVDSILIDEARTPLIISGPSEETTDLYLKINAIIPKLDRQETEDGPGDYSVDEKTRQAFLTEAGHDKVERLLVQAGLLEQGGNLYDVSSLALMHHLNAALRAHALYKRDVDYIVRDGQVIIIDEFTGRMMVGRRWSEGLHQAVEAKEGVPIENENQTLATITFQNYFRLYEKLAGMTGTADTEAFEFQQIYGLEVVVMPTHRPMIRQDMGDQVYRTTREKHGAILADIKDCYERGQPVLVGTTSIEASEQLARLLDKDKIPHQVLNAKHHEKEAVIVAQAGRPKAVTIATNMAGRGTDIVLGGNPAAEIAAAGDDEAKKQEMMAEWQKRHDFVVSAGGLHVLGTERHESRRIDNQLRGRSGRQGDPGSSRFYLSLEDNLLRIFGSDRVAGIMQRLGMEEGEAIEHPWVTKAIENAQRKVEGRNFDIRKQLLEYDDVANEQRKVIYEQRNRLLDVDDISESIRVIRRDIVSALVAQHMPSESVEEQWDVGGLEEALAREFNLRLPLRQWLDDDSGLDDEKLVDRVVAELERVHEEKAAAIGADMMRHLEKAVMLQVLDQQWKDHLAAMDYLRQGIHLRGYAQKNPKQEYKREAFELFSDMLARVKQEVVTLLARVQLQQPETVQAFEPVPPPSQEMQFLHPSVNAEAEEESEVAVAQRPMVRKQPKVGRNQPCPCGSGKKYKHCHGKLA